MTPQNWYRPSRCNYIYFCRVLDDGTFDLGPMDWTLAKTGIGAYVITHDLGHVRYFALTQAHSGDYKDAAIVENSTENDITITTFNNGQPADWDFDLLIFAAQ